MNGNFSRREKSSEVYFVFHCRENNKNKGSERYLGKIRKETVLKK